MDDLTTPSGQLLAGVLAHLTGYLTNGCARSAHLAALLLDQLAADAGTDDRLRQPARQLVEILERGQRNLPAAPWTSGWRRPQCGRQGLIRDDRS